MYIGLFTQNISKQRRWHWVFFSLIDEDSCEEMILQKIHVSSHGGGRFDTQKKVLLILDFEWLIPSLPGRGNARSKMRFGAQSLLSTPSILFHITSDEQHCRYAPPSPTSEAEVAYDQGKNGGIYTRGSYGSVKCLSIRRI